MTPPSADNSVQCRLRIQTDLLMSSIPASRHRYPEGDSSGLLFRPRPIQQLLQFTPVFLFASSSRCGSSPTSPSGARTRRAARAPLASGSRPARCGRDRAVRVLGWRLHSQDQVRRCSDLNLNRGPPSRVTSKRIGWEVIPNNAHRTQPSCTGPRLIKSGPTPTFVNAEGDRSGPVAFHEGRISLSLCRTQGVPADEPGLHRPIPGVGVTKAGAE